jgi:hypothetical protein
MDRAKAQAPLHGFRWSGVEIDEVRISEGLYLVYQPKVLPPEDYTSLFGTAAVDDITSADWAFEFRYDANANSHLGPEEEEAKRTLFQALLALWITRPSGARFSHIAITHDRHGSEAHSIERFEPFVPHSGWQSKDFSNADIQPLGAVFEGIKTVYAEKLPLRIALGALAAALPTRTWEPRLIGLVTALECLLRPGDSGTKRRLQERAAVLLHEHDDQRRAVFKDIGSIYDARSTLVHGRELQIDEDRSRWMLMRLESMVQGAAKKVYSFPEMVTTFADSNAHGRYFQRELQGVEFYDSDQQAPHAE